MQQQLYDLLHLCTVRVSIEGIVGHGTGFFVAPGLILTCAHVVKDAQSGKHTVQVYWNGQQLSAKLTKYVPEDDLALLQVDLKEHPCVLLQEEVTPFDALYSYGYPDDHPMGDPATFALEGKAGERGEQFKLKSGQARPGLSGAPLLNVRTGCVCGIVQKTRDRNSDLGGRAIPTAIVLKTLHDEIVDAQRQFHQWDRRWTDMLKQRPASVRKDTPRRRMLAKVQSIWITGFLEQSLRHTALITPGLQEQPEAVDNPIRLEMQELDWSARLLPTNTHITQVYDDANGELLILGEPGAGKTTLLLELARELLDRAEKNENHPIPVIFNLSWWVLRRQPLTDWLAEELYSKYQVPLSLGQSWVAVDQILPLLDGLDEVSPALREECVKAINTYRQEHGLQPTVVCSRSADYLALAHRVRLTNAVVVQPLTTQQIDDYLSTLGEKVAAVRVAFHSDPLLQELASTPLMLSVLVQTYQDISVEDILAQGSPPLRRQEVFAAYVHRMLLRRGSHRYTREQTMRYLTWLASMLVLFGQTEFYFWLVQPGWFPGYRSKQLYRGIVQLLVISTRCLIFGVIGGLIFGLLMLLPVGLAVELLGALCGGLLSVWLSGLDKQTGWIREIAQRFILWRAGYMPWNYADFLDYAVERILLRKVGEGYVFVHRLLRDYFATLHAEPASNDATAQTDQLANGGASPSEESSHVLQSQTVNTLTGFTTARAPHHLDVYDMRGVSHDEQLSVTTMAGLINRQQPQVYLINTDDDFFWLNEVLTFILHDTPFVANNAILNALLTTYRTSVQGMIIYDPDFIDSINIATTMAGQRDAIVVSPAQAQPLQQDPHKLPVLADLRTYHWHSRLHAYHWAQQHLLSQASTYSIAGLSPNNVTGLRSFLVATRSFVYWLDARKRLPDPRCNWMSERGLMRRILRAFPPGTMHHGWFIDERQGVKLTSEAAKATLATDFFYNLEVWATIPPSEPGAKLISKVPAKSTATPAPKIYVSFTMSDGESLQYLQHRMLRLWHDPSRGSVPIGWTISAALSQFAPNMAAYYLRSITPNDELIAGPSGAGYMFPSCWPLEHLPTFLQETGQLMQSMGLTTIDILDKEGGMRFFDATLQQWFAQALFPFDVHGVLSGFRSPLIKPTWTVSAAAVNTPIYYNFGLANSVSNAVRLIKNVASGRNERPLFINVFILAWTMTPSDLKQVVEQLGSDYEIVTPGTLLAMVAEVER